MSRNIPQWSQQILGKAITPQQFMANPKLQDQIAMGKMQQYLQQYGTPQDVASMWFSGRPASKGSGAYDPTSQLSTGQYVQQVMNKMNPVGGVRD